MSAEILWEPPAGARSSTRLGRYMAWLQESRRLSFATYDELWQWSVDDLEGFWASLWEYFGIRSSRPYTRVLSSREMPGARWFEGALLNYAEHELLTGGDAPAVLSYSQSRPPVVLSAGELRDEVARVRAGLQRLGVGRGDRVAAYLPNIAETLVAFLATATLGAVWSSCAPEFGRRSVVDRFRQIEPKVLLAVDGYRYGEKAIDRGDDLAAIRAELPSLRATVLLPYLDAGARVEGTTPWSDLRAVHADLEFEQVPFDHPLYILYSSGTTGLPKPIVHGHGGILMEHLKTLLLHSDLGAGDRFFWFSTTGWMMWNYLVSGLLAGAAVVCFDGDPGFPDMGALWRLAEESGMTWFGTSAPYLMACRKAGLRPGADNDLSALRGVGSTGAPLPAEGFRWVYEAIGRDLLLSSVSGGTDVCTAFVGGCPILPVRAGEISCRYLGVRAEAYDETGHPLIGAQGELVVTEPMPSMPVGFWGDTDGSRYRAAYFDVYPGIWRHGDWITITEDGSCIISGRSDATLNRGGVRVGTAEFYSVVEGMDQVVDSIVVHLDADEGNAVGELLLFVVAAPGVVAGDDLRTAIAREVRVSLSPRHVPDRIEFVEAVPRTLSGKKLEVPVKRVLMGMPADRAASRDALVRPDALEMFVELARRRQAERSSTG
ncbi:MAG TPA: acetoacetate--CoA ligase [Candidatus Dormibacteraeota bacterium]|jgi:acetoacetyl-CoA synthetase|nr:acetoacetate--CoA ligase [Candidatus Dormibacteraeota bacterium]